MGKKRGVLGRRDAGCGGAGLYEQKERHLTTTVRCLFLIPGLEGFLPIHADFIGATRVLTTLLTTLCTFVGAESGFRDGSGGSGRQRRQRTGIHCTSFRSTDMKHCRHVIGRHIVQCIPGTLAA